MKHLRFEKLEILSPTEGRAVQIEFHPRLTVIDGDNDVGKSSVIKSLYWAFGAPSVMNPSWLAAKVKVLVTFTVNGQRHAILRDGTSITLFDVDGRATLSTTSITSELGPEIARMLDFGLVLSNRKGMPETPPPAFAFLPFYVDQDKGWNQPLESFENLQQYRAFRKDLIEFHSGIRPNGYYVLNAERKQVAFERDEIQRDRSAVSKAIERMGLAREFTGLELNVPDHEASIERLLMALRDLRVVRQRRASELADLLDQQVAIKEQIAITHAALKELTKDVDWLSERREEALLCPTCGTSHDNDFINRFAIIDDREACLSFLTESREQLFAISRKVTAIEGKMQKSQTLADEMASMLAQRKGDVTLKDVIDSEGRRNASVLLEEQLRELDESISAKGTEITEIDRGMKAFANPARKTKIQTFYATRMLSYLETLDVQNIDHASVSKIERKIHDTGSDQPRAVLAYYLALMRSIYEFSDSLTAPMVIDSPNQQDQDASNIAAMIRLIISERPEGGQTVLGTVSLQGQTVEDGKVITLTEKNSVLNERDYAEVSARLKPYLDQVSPF